MKKQLKEELVALAEKIALLKDRRTGLYRRIEGACKELV